MPSPLSIAINRVEFRISPKVQARIIKIEKYMKIGNCIAVNKYKDFITKGSYCEHCMKSRKDKTVGHGTTVLSSTAEGLAPQSSPLSSTDVFNYYITKQLIF